MIVRFEYCGSGIVFTAADVYARYRKSRLVCVLYVGPGFDLTSPPL